MDQVFHLGILSLRRTHKVLMCPKPYMVDPGETLKPRSTPVEQILHGIFVHLERVHKVLRVTPDPQRVAPSEFPACGSDVSCK